MNLSRGETQEIPIEERIRRLPEALMLTAGYYASRMPLISEFLRRLD